ncbi:hypothetical protein TrVGV298_009376 [Trichoderma virens]|nr:hypothetical protein TrVGV298_009376 [Trichoderma virens]
MPRRRLATRLFCRREWQCIASVHASARAPFSSHSSSCSPVNVQEMKSRPAKVIHDYLIPMPSHLLTTTLSDLLHTPLASGSSMVMEGRTLPQGHHLVYFPLQTPASGLASDGADQDHAPDEEFTKRLWAGGRCGLGGGGWCWMGGRGFVRRRLEMRYGLGHDGDAGEWDIEERRTLVFMRKTEHQDQGPGGRLVKYAHPPTHSASLIPTPTHLFHFSALTYNAHSIHIDPLYAKSQDGHRALLVHGPLSLALMLRVLNDHVAPKDGGGVVKSIAYRNYAPLYVGEEMKVCVRRTKGNATKEEEEWDVWIEGPEGGLAVKGSVVVGAK